ncbi:MAG TPA: AAA family ATPase, partial [Solirubrobacteraceae bacterium]
MNVAAVEPDPFDARRARAARGLPAAFNAAGVLAAADVHVAVRLCELAGEADEAVVLAAALAVRGPRLGHVLVDLATIARTATVDQEEPVDVAALPWPDPAPWVERVRASPLVAAGDDARPLRLAGTRLYLDRYWREEADVAAALEALAGAPPASVDAAVLRDGLRRLFPEGDERQRLAAATAVLRRLAVVAGGPGTGKTTTVARVVALLAEQAAAAGAPEPLVALAAPTAKAAARLGEAVRDAARELDAAPPIRAQLERLDASTLHRLLGRHPGSHSRFRHDRGNRLPHDVIVVDETSMVPLTLMARLLEAARRDARLVLVGDPGQLRSIEAGAVLGDIVGPAADGPLMAPAARERLADVIGAPVPAADPPPGAAIADGIVVLERVHRFGRGIGRVAEAIRLGDGDAVVAALREGPEGVRWLAADAGDPAAQATLEPVRDAAAHAA